MPTKKKSKNEPKHWLDHPANVKKFLNAFFGLCALLLLIDLVFGFGWHKHAAFHDGMGGLVEGPETWPVFYAVYGFVSCAALILISKAMRSVNGRRILMRDEDYWEKE